MPPNCLKDVIPANMKSDIVPCTCLAKELRDEKSVTLLMIDTEGYGAQTNAMSHTRLHAHTN